MTAGGELPDLPPMVRTSRLVPPPRPPSGRLGITTVDDVRALIEQADDDPGAYWLSVAEQLEWAGGWPPDPPMTGSLATGFEWFPGATGNVSVNCVDRHARSDPDRVAIHWVGEDGARDRWTYGQLLDHTSRFARALADLGVRRGDVVVLLLPNLLETFAAVHACFRLGAIYNVVFSGFSPQALADRIVDTGAAVVVTCDQTLRRGRTIDLKRTLDQVVDTLPSVRHVVVVRRTGDPTVPMRPGRDVFYDELLARTPSGIDPVPVEANEPGFLIYTSGTTAKPKGLVHSAMGFLVGALRNVQMSLDLGPEDVYWCTADVGWLTFPIFELVGATALGATMVAVEGALDHPRPDRAYQLIEELGVTKLFTAPTVLRMWARAGASWARSHDLGSLRLVSLVGEPLDATTWEWVHDTIGDGQLEINNTYGQSETGSAWTSSVVGITPAKPGSCGIALPGHRFAVVDDDGRRVPTGQVGFLVLEESFPAMFRGVWHDPERYRSQYFTRFGPDRYDSADAALVDHDGHVWVVGRVDGVINVAAHRLSTMEMESALLDVPGVAEAAVVGVHDPDKGQLPVGFVTCAQGHEGRLDPEELADALVTAIGPIARPKAIHIVSTMPRTRSGKIVRRLLAELVTTGQAVGDTSGLEDPEVLHVLARELTLAE
jgi:acetyl-CoA synthetase